MLTKHKGFTVIQILAAMLIFCILTGAAFFGTNVYVTQANYDKADSDLKAYQTAVEMSISYNKPKIMKKAFTPETLNKYLDAGDKVTAVAGDENQVYQTALTDPWGNPYRVSVNYEGDSGDLKMQVKVESSGKDGTFGTGDESNVVVEFSRGEVSSARINGRTGNSVA